MKILYVTDALAIWGGMERVLVHKANYLATHGGYKVFMLTVCQGNHFFPFPLDPRVTHVDLNIPFHTQYLYFGIRRILSLWRMHRKCREGLRHQLFTIQPDIIVCPRIEFVRDICKMKRDIPLVFESHSTFWTSRYEGAGLLRCLHTFLMNLSARNADAIVALTEEDASVWHKLNKSTYVIPDTVQLNDSCTYSDVLSKSVMFVGRFSCQKDIGSLLAIWRMVYLYHSDWQLHIYGEKGDIDDDLYNQLFTAGLGIVVHAPTQQIQDEYKKHAILLLSSKYEPFGMVLPEAMSCGLPVVSFDCPYGPKDIITDGVNGFLIKGRDVDYYAKKVCLLMDNYNLRKNMGKKAILSAQRFSMNVIMPKWYELFETLA